MKDQLPPEGGAEFERLMLEIDELLAAGGAKIQGRAWRAVTIVSRRYGVPIPVAMGRRPGPPDLERWADLSEKIHDWFSQTYGEKMNIDPSPGRVAVEIRSDLFAITLPRVWGSFRPLLSRQSLELPKIGNNAPISINLIQTIEDLTPAKAGRLTDDDLRRISEAFFEGMEAYTTLESNLETALIQLAQGDLRTAVEKLFDSGDRWGESKWASLQAAEKSLKAALSNEGTSIPKTHKLQELIDLIHSPTTRIRLAVFAGKIQCSPAIRYGDESCTRAEAVVAHRAVLRLIRGLSLERNAPLAFLPKWRALT